MILMILNNAIYTNQLMILITVSFEHFVMKRTILLIGLLLLILDIYVDVQMLDQVIDKELVDILVMIDDMALLALDLLIFELSR